MKLLFLTHNLFDQGGSYRRALGLAGAMATRGHRVTLICGRSQRGLRSFSTTVDGVHVLSPPDWGPSRARHGGLSPLDVLGRLLLLRQVEPDVVHAFDHRPSVSFPAWVLSRVRKALLVSDWADLWGFGGIADTRSAPLRHTLGRLDHYSERRWRRRVNGVTAASSLLGSLAIEAGVRPERCWILPAGANPESFDLVGRREARRELGVSADARVIAHTGYAPYDEPLLVGTLAEVLVDDPGAVALTTGRRPQGLGDQLDAVGRTAAWRHLGTIPHRRLGVVMSAADVLLLPYSDTTINLGRFPNKLGDYLSAGRPVVTNPTGDLGRWVDVEGVGLLADESPTAMAAAIQRLFSEPDFADAMGKRASKLAAGGLAWKTLAGEVEDFYQRLMA